MWAAIGDKDPPTILDLNKHMQVLHPAPDTDINLALVKDYVARYDLYIKVGVGENRVKLFHQTFCKWFLKLHKVQSWPSSTDLSLDKPSERWGRALHEKPNRYPNCITTTQEICA